ncbi:hypothetical protein BDY19DRAFT_1041588 [Irpex rosettiformis]|uniref:Uncharacterized protein n=1 Tax=Irpex rosettiformis TaxID=378272 RepID=A0ACB8U4T7_9APHY|nr:hypothetical protein BDY19DRAFT_1041588 [Irpex rosettiformis]
MSTVRLLTRHNQFSYFPRTLVTGRRCYSENPSHTDHRASAKLFQDAANEDAEEAEQAARASRLNALETKHQNWDGEESMQDAVLRMLVDKYKPLRTGVIRTADEKLKKAAPRLGNVDIVEDGGLDAFRKIEEEEKIVVQTTWGASSQSLADVPLLPSIEGHQPWHTTFTVPSHAQSSIKYGNIPPSPPTKGMPPAVLDDKARRQARDARKRTEHAGRLRNARESMLDYMLGVKGEKTIAEGAVRRRPNPLGLKGWASLVEDRIERARREGRFNNISGRGQPLKRFTEERNPFIAREEFLMNRIVQRNGAAPPWIEIQGELESALYSFRNALRDSWTRRAIRMLTLSRSAALLPKLSLAEVTSWRDTEWEAREKSYHDTALAEINSLVRKYNGLAPYPVRRIAYSLEVELSKVYQESGEDILLGIAERANSSSYPTTGPIADSDDERVGSGGAATDGLAPVRIRDVIRQWITSVKGK